MSAVAHGNFSGKRLVIFGAGYVGCEIARQAFAHGLQVTAVTRNPEKAAALQALGVTTVVADLADPGWHGRVAGEVDFALNCVSSGGGGLPAYERSYFLGMASILSWARISGAIGTLVYTSSTSVYPQDHGSTVDEKAELNREDDRPKVLADTEQLLVALADRTRRISAADRWFVLRLAGIYGPGRHHLLEQVRSGEVSGQGHHRLNLIHRDDICAAIWAAFAARPEIKNEIFNVADDGATKKSEVVEWLAAKAGVAAPRFTGEPLGGRRAVTPDRVITNGKLKQLLGWKPQYPSFREGYTALLAAPG
jgi:nucleoside-diphosphate-sugar epimerase